MLLPSAYVAKEVAEDNPTVEWVDIVKYICIIAVIMMHVDGNTGFWYQGCGSFLLKGFFFVSGYVYLHSKDFKGFFVNSNRYFTISISFF